MVLLKLPMWDFFKSDYENRYRYLKFEIGDYLMYALVFIFILATIGFVIWVIYDAIYNYLDRRKSTTHTFLGELIDKKYIGEQHSSGTGTAVIPSTNGGVGVGVISINSTTDESFLFFVRDTKVYKINVDMQSFYSRNVGDKVVFEVKVGGLSKKDLTVSMKQN